MAERRVSSSSRTKRTYNLSATTLRQVRELAAEYGLASSQDAVVELAVDQLYREAVEREESARWTDAATDPEFRREATGLADLYADVERWPK